jgi:hypothetical protein
MVEKVFVEPRMKRLQENKIVIDIFFQLKSI